MARVSEPAPAARVAGQPRRPEDVVDALRGEDPGPEEREEPVAERPIDRDLARDGAPQERQVREADSRRPGREEQQLPPAGPAERGCARTNRNPATGTTKASAMRWVRTIATQQASERTSVHGRPRARKLTAEANDERAERDVEAVVPDRPCVEPEVRRAEQGGDEPRPEPERPGQPEQGERDDEGGQHRPERHQGHQVGGEGEVQLVQPGRERAVDGAGGAGQSVNRQDVARSARRAPAISIGSSPTHWMSPGCSAGRRQSTATQVTSGAVSAEPGANGGGRGERRWPGPQAGSAVRVSRIRMRLPKGMNQREWGTASPSWHGTLDAEEGGGEGREEMRRGDQVPAEPPVELGDHPRQLRLDG